MHVLDDGIYDAIVIDARREVVDGATYLELAITSGVRKGDVVQVRADRDLGDELALLAMPATIVVEHGVPDVKVDR